MEAIKNQYIPKKIKIIEVKEETKDVKTFKFQFLSQEENRFNFKPGNFNLLSKLGAGEAAFSLTSDSEEGNYFENTIRKVGRVTSTIFNMKVGDILGFRGPFGNGWPLSKAVGMDLVLIAGGLGLAPLRPVIYHISKHRSFYGSVDILYGARTPMDMIYTNEFKLWQEIPDVKLELTVDVVPNGVSWKHNVGVVTTLFKNIRAKPDSSVVMMCGPEIMMKFASELLLRMEFPKENVYVSLERRMRCGVTKCGHCQIGPKFVCRDGPVFSLAEIWPLPDVIE
ncbi:MAG: hypothetical protein HA495_03625 [Thaumarchaeota archaeon]|nr:hypothetical protein [Nitrososphaerota archaeon]